MKRWRKKLEVQPEERNDEKRNKKNDLRGAIEGIKKVNWLREVSNVGGWGEKRSWKLETNDPGWSEK